MLSPAHTPLPNARTRAPIARHRSSQIVTQQLHCRFNCHGRISELSIHTVISPTHEPSRRHPSCDVYAAPYITSTVRLSQVSRYRLQFVDVSRRLFALVRYDAPIEHDAECNEHADRRHDDDRRRDRSAPSESLEAHPRQYRHLADQTK